MLTLATDGHTNPLEDGAYIAEGTNVTLTEAGGTVVNATVGANGLVEVTLPFGNWTIKVGNYRSQSFTTSNNATMSLTKTLVYEMFADSTITDSYISNGYKFNEAGSAKNFKDSDIVYAEMTIKSPTNAVISALTGQTSAQTIGAQIKNNSAPKYGVVAGSAGVTSVVKSDMFLRWASSNPSNWTTTTNAATFASDFVSAYDAGTLKIGMLIKGGHAWCLVGIGNNMYYDDCWTRGDFTNVAYIDNDLVAEFSNVRFARSLDTLPELGYGIFTDEYQGFEAEDCWTVTENADGSYDIAASTSAATKLPSIKTYTNKYMTNAADGTNGYVFTKDSQISFDVEIIGNANESNTGWWLQFWFGGAWTVPNLQFCSWNGNVNAKNGGSTEAVSAANMLTKGATRVDNGDGTYTWTFSGVYKADANGYIALYNSNGELLYTTASVGTAYKMELFNEFWIAYGNSGSSATFEITNLKIDI